MNYGFVYILSNPFRGYAETEYAGEKAIEELNNHRSPVYYRDL